MCLFLARNKNFRVTASGSAVEVADFFAAVFLGNGTGTAGAAFVVVVFFLACFALADMFGYAKKTKYTFF